MAYSKVRLVGRWITPDGTPARGTVTITPSVPAIVNPGGPILAGPVQVALDADGRLDVELPATDDPRLHPVGFTYAVTVAMARAYWGVSGVAAPAAAGVVDLTAAR